MQDWIKNGNFRSWYLYLTLFASGAFILVIEIAGTRVLSPFYGSTIFVWSSLIAITLGFLALGYFVGGFIADRHPRGSWFYSIIFLGGAASLSLIKINQPLLVFTDQFGLRAGPLVAALLLFALPLFILSMAGPFAIRLSSRELAHTGHSAGVVFGISTVGSLVGALLVGFYLIPNLFLADIFTVSAALIMLIAIGGLLLEKSSWWMIAVSVLLLGILLLIPFLKYDSGDTVSIIHHEPSFYADLKVGKVANNHCLFMDGMAQTCMSALGKGFSLDPYVLEIKNLSKTWPADSKVLLLGLGGGALVKDLASNFAMDIVELDPKIAKLARKYFNLNLDENDTLTIGDARNFLRQEGDTYDVIISDLYIGGAIPIHLYTKEMMELINNRLSDRGVAIINIAGALQSDLISSLVHTERTVFPTVIVMADSAEDKFTNILVYASRNVDYYPQENKYYTEQMVDLTGAKLITDLKNPLDLMTVASVESFFKNSKKNFGYTSMFAL